MTDYGYRYFHPELGRWISRDPIGEEGGLNLYAFVGNDPITQVDYVGLAIIYTCVAEGKVFLNQLPAPGMPRVKIPGGGVIATGTGASESYKEAYTAAVNEYYKNAGAKKAGMLPAPAGKEVIIDKPIVKCDHIDACGPSRPDKNDAPPSPLNPNNPAPPPLPPPRLPEIREPQLT